ncbi:siderophore-interacting protein [Ruegeria sp. Ofav3-42]|uniref:siderophore-interacting protein n=1 Tax=Ruegeria sp. Ofav3-42 TaxID=2917759 RepID=UPI001EF69396|nr:siderophore-interacting protein [Ruegeria sp. Ofav3-42]MCG7519910.1 siderophore-interacting protein [Ruegeria sp. Ofav3-42]
MAQSKGRNLQVVRAWDLSPNMRRVVLGGEDLRDFPQGNESGYIKLIFPDAPRAHPDRPVMRTYTIRAHDPVLNELTVDFALHGDSGGLAAVWAQNAQPGSEIQIAGPGTIKQVDANSDWVLLAGDMTAMPALLCILETLPDSTVGDVVLELTSAEDTPDVHLPKGITLHTVINPTPHEPSTAFVDKVRSLPWRDGHGSLWAACEFNSMRALRTYFRTERGVSRDQLYLSSYWKSGATEEEHKKIKGADATQQKVAAMPKAFLNKLAGQVSG